MRTTPKISLSLSEFGHLVVGLGVLGWTMTLAVVTRSPWRVFMSADKRRAFLREIANVMIRTGGYWLSIRHLQFMMPSTRSTVQIWGFMNWTKVHSEEVLSSDTLATASTEVNPWVHWIGEKPTRGEPSIDGKVLLYVHGGGFVLPLSSGHLAMVTTLLREAKSKSSKPIYLAVAEYTIAPYGQHPTQIKQCISVIHHLHSQYGVESSNIVIAGDSCGGALSLSILSHFLHPEPTLPPLPYIRGTNKPFAGMLLVSPWASFCTTSPSYTTNAELDTLPPSIIQRFRDAYIARTPLLPTTQSSPMMVASVTGRYYTSVQDPVIIGLDRGVGLIRPIGSYKQQAGRDQWWDGLGSVVSRIMITSGELECFRDDIITLVNTMKGVASQDNRVTLESIEDDSFHAVLVSDFAFGAPLSTFAARLSGWLVDTLVDSEEVQ